jgi:hypothetical protein
MNRTDALVLFAIVTAATQPGCTGPAGDSTETQPDDSQDVSNNSGWYMDDDGDGYTTATDCNDANDAVHPDATEDCGNGIDDDCDMLTDGEDADCTASGQAATAIDWARLAFCAPEAAPAGLRGLRGKPSLFRTRGA